MIQLRKHQFDAANAVEDAWHRGIKRPLGNLCVGSGKSLLFAELARREIGRGGRALIVVHTRELVQQNAEACRMLGLKTGINAAALGERTWRAPVISAAIQSVHRYAHNFGQVTLLMGDECHLWPHSEDGMYRRLVRGLGDARIAGASGTVFRLQGGSLVEGESAPFDEVVYNYSILDGINDGYLVPAFSLGADDAIDTSRLRTRNGEFTAESADEQMLRLMDSHIAQMVHYGADRRAWLIFEASVKAAKAMAARLTEWGVPTGLVLGETPDGERARLIDAYRRGLLRALVNVNALTTGFDVQQVDFLVMRRPTKSLGLYIQMAGRLLRTIGGNIEASRVAGKADGAVLDFAGNIDRHGPLDFLHPRQTRAHLVSCEACGARNSGAALKCWSCDAPMTKFCPACLGTVRKGVLDCPHCGFDMRTGPSEGGGGAKLSEAPSGAALISNWKGGTGLSGGWLPVGRTWAGEDGEMWCDLPGVPGASEGERVALPRVIFEALKGTAPRWIRRRQGGGVEAVLLMQGASRTFGRQVGLDGREIIVPLPARVSGSSQGEAA